MAPEILNYATPTERVTHSRVGIASVTLAMVGWFFYLQFENAVQTRARSYAGFTTNGHVVYAAGFAYWIWMLLTTAAWAVGTLCAIRGLRDSRRRRFFVVVGLLANVLTPLLLLVEEFLPHL